MSMGLLTPGLLQLWNERFREIPGFCGNDIVVGVDEVEQWRDWTDIETTVDQRRIEAYLKTRAMGGERVLHVGIGNSSLAVGFAPIYSSIVGISITPRELERAAALNFPNYHLLFLNKYSLAFAEAFSKQFDVIIDNNPSTFGCCFFHLIRMLSAYREMLNDGGQIVTDKLGLGHVSSAPQSNPRFKFDFTDWRLITQECGFVTEAIDEDIYISRTPVRFSRNALRAIPDLRRRAQRKLRRWIQARH